MKAVSHVLALASLFASSLSDFEKFFDKTDHFKRSIYLRESDKFILRFSNLLDVSGQSVNFFCDNNNVEVPGVNLTVTTTPNPVDKSFRGSLFQSYSNYLFFITENRFEHFFYRVKEDNKDLELLQNSQINDTIKTILSAVPVDESKKKQGQLAKEAVRVKMAEMAVLPPARLMIFAHRSDELSSEDRTHEKYAYYFICYNFAKNKVEYNLRVEGQFFDHPTLRVFSDPRNTKNEIQNIMVVFNKDDHSEGRFETIKKVTLFTLTKREGREWRGESRSKFIYEIIPGLLEAYVRLMDVVLSPSPELAVPADGHPNYNAFFLVKRLDKNSVITYESYRCDFNYRDFVAGTGEPFSDCAIYRPRVMRHMLLQDQLFITIEKITATKESINFCTVSLEYCKTGLLDPSWEVVKVLMKEAYGVVILKVQGVHVMVVNNFMTNELVYFYEDMSGVKEVNLQQQMVDGKPHLYLIRVYESSFTRKDITLRFDTEIEGRYIVDREPIHVRLENELVEELSVFKWDGSSIVDLLQGRTMPILRLTDGTFRTRLGIAGSNLHFLVDENKGMIFHFNRMRLSFESAKESRGKRLQVPGPAFIYKNFLVTDTEIITNSCQADLYELRLECFEVRRCPFIRPIRAAEIQSIVEMRDLLVIWFLGTERTLFFDKTLNRHIPMRMPKSFKGSTLCTMNEEFIACRFGNQTDGIDALRLFKIDKDQIIEQPKFEKEVLQAVRQQLVSRMEGAAARDLGKGSAIRILDFGFDKVRTRTFYILYSIDVDGSFQPALLEFAFCPLKSQSCKHMALFVERKWNLDRNRDINQKVGLFVLNYRILFITVKPKAKIWMVSEDSVSNFDFIDMQDVLKVITELSCNLLGIVYRHHENNKEYIVIYRLTMNSVKQMVRNEAIPNYSASTRFSLYPVSDNVAALVIYDMDTRVVQNSYFYFMEGPFFQYSDPTVPILVDDRQIQVRFEEDFSFDASLVRYISDKTIQLDKSQNSKTIMITKYVEIIGNVRDISVVGEYASKSQVSMRRPLAFHSEMFIGECFDAACANMRLYSDENYIIYHEKSDKPEYKMRSKRNMYSVFEIKIDLPEGYLCSALLLAHKKIICFWLQGSVSRATIYFIDEGKQQLNYELPVAVKSPVLLFDKANTLVIAFIEHASREVGIFQIYWEDKAVAGSGKGRVVTRQEIPEVKWFEIGPKELLTEDLHVTSFVAFSHAESNMLYLIILDSWTNNLYFYKATLKDIKEMPTLKNTVPLQGLDSLFFEIICEMDSERIIFSCFLYSVNFIFKARISISVDSVLSDFKWVFETEGKLYNTLYESTFDNEFNIEMRASHSRLVTFERNPFVAEQRKLIFYDLESANPQHSNFVYDLSTHENILDIMFEESLNQVHIYFTEKKNIRRTALTIGEYAIDIVNIARPEQERSEDHEIKPDLGLVLDKDLEVAVEFQNSNRYLVKFSFSSHQGVEEKARASKSEMTSVLLATVLVLSLLVLSLVLSLVILMEKKARSQRRLARLQAAGDESGSIVSSEVSAT